MQYEGPDPNTNAPYTDPNPALGDPGALIRAPALENHQRELVNLLLAASITPSRGDLTQLTQAVQKLIGDYGRPRLLADLNYYIATTGNDLANGLTPGTPFASWNRALTAAAQWDMNGHSVVINVADGTYSTAVFYSGGFVGVGSALSVVVRGNLVNPQNVILNVTGSNAIRLTGPTTGVHFEGFEVRTTGLGNSGFLLSDYARASFSTLRFGACGENHMQADSVSQITPLGNYSIVGGARQHWNAADGGRIVVFSPTITLTGVPAFSVAFGNARELGNLRCTGTTFSGTATGKRFQTDSNSLIYVSGAGDGYFPGNALGTRTNGGIYA